MNLSRYMISFFIGLSLLSIFPFYSNAADEDPNRKALSDLLNELELKIKDADKRMIAHPNFLKELQALVDQYRSKLRNVYFSDDFADGDYTNNPEWKVISGQFIVTSGGGLQSRLGAQRPAEKPAAEQESDLFGSIFKEVIRSTTNTKEENAPTNEIEEASIRTRADIGPAFEVDLKMVSNSEWGSMEIVLLGGENLTPCYRLAYQASPSSTRPIQIFRERGSRKYLIEEALKYPSLDDGLPHRIQWIRDSQGNMSVLVDGVEVLSTVEFYYNQAFSGISLVNNGGVYEWGPITILEATKE